MFDKLKAMGAVANLMKNQEGLKVAAARVREKMENTRVNGEAGSGAARAVVSPNFYGSGHPAESCVTVTQWSLKSIGTGRPA